MYKGNTIEFVKLLITTSNALASNILKNASDQDTTPKLSRYSTVVNDDNYPIIHNQQDYFDVLFDDVGLSCTDITSVPNTDETIINEVLPNNMDQEIQTQLNQLYSYYRNNYMTETASNPQLNTSPARINLQCDNFWLSDNLIDTNYTNTTNNKKSKNVISINNTATSDQSFLSPELLSQLGFAPGSTQSTNSGSTSDLSVDSNPRKKHKNIFATSNPLPSEHINQQNLVSTAPYDTNSVFFAKFIHEAMKWQSNPSISERRNALIAAFNTMFPIGKEREKALSGLLNKLQTPICNIGVGGYVQVLSSFMEILRLKISTNEIHIPDVWVMLTKLITPNDGVFPLQLITDEKLLVNFYLSIVPSNMKCDEIKALRTFIRNAISGATAQLRGTLPSDEEVLYARMYFNSENMLGVKPHLFLNTIFYMFAIMNHSMFKQQIFDFSKKQMCSDREYSLFTTRFDALTSPCFMSIFTELYEDVQQLKNTNYVFHYQYLAILDQLLTIIDSRIFEIFETKSSVVKHIVNNGEALDILAIIDEKRKSWSLQRCGNFLNRMCVVKTILDPIKNLMKGWCDHIQMSKDIVILSSAYQVTTFLTALYDIVDLVNHLLMGCTEIYETVTMYGEKLDGKMFETLVFHSFNPAAVSIFCSMVSMRFFGVCQRNAFG